MEEKAVVGWTDHGLTRGEFTASLADLVAYSIVNRVYAGKLRLEYGPVMDTARNLLVEQFLETPADWLLQIDTDHSYAPSVLHELLEVARSAPTLVGTPPPIVSGLTWGYLLDRGQYPVVYRLDDEGHPRIAYDTDWTRGDVIDVDTTGAACLLVHRDVFGKMEHGTWFDRMQIDGKWVGEDLSFGLRAREGGNRIICATGVEFKHIKAGFLDWNSYALDRPK